MKTSSMLAGSAVAVLLGSLAALAGCAKQEAAAPAAPLMAAPLPGGLQPQASVLDLMMEFIDPNADELWESVAVVSTRTGVEERHPKTDADWKLARRKALTLIETANLLVVGGRQVANPGQSLDQPGGEGDYTPAQAQAEIAKDRGAFVGFAKAFQDAAAQMLDAINKKSPDAMLESGGLLDEACEDCHRKFWYPKSPLPPGA